VAPWSTEYLRGTTPVARHFKTQEASTLGFQRFRSFDAVPDALLAMVTLPT
jgi:hypothetical protein